MSTPLVSDEQITKVMSDQFTQSRDHVVACGAARALRNIYEPELQSMRERLRRMEAALRRAQESICYAMEEGVDIGGTAYIDEALSNK